jgi:hypothetical protein
MKNKRVKKLLKKVARQNDFEINAFDVDPITGMKKRGNISLFGVDQNGFSILIAALRNEKGVVDKIDYLNAGPSIDDLNDNLFVSVDVNDIKMFVKDLGDTFKRTTVGPSDLESFADAVDSIAGVQAGPFSTYVSASNGEYYAFA